MCIGRYFVARGLLSSRHSEFQQPDSSNLQHRILDPVGEALGNEDSEGSSLALFLKVRHISL
jgi:hypothetical protein